MGSFGGPNHQLDLWLWVAFLLIFLPGLHHIEESMPSDIRRKFLLVFWGVQAFILLTYSMSGTGKIVAAITQYWRGAGTTIFSFDAAALHISTILNQMRETTILGPLIINYPILGWLPFLVALYLELFSFFVAFRPSLHRPWTAALIFFHIGTYITMRAVFVAPSALLLIFLFASPFRSSKPWRHVLLDLPLVKEIWHIIKR